MAEIEAAGYQVAFSGQKTYNGVAILSRQPITDVVRNNPLFQDEQQRMIAATIEGVRIICAYVPNGQAVGSDKYEYKLAWLAALREWLGEEMASMPQLAILGDYNIAPEDRDVHDPAAWAGQVLVSRPGARRRSRADRPGPGRCVPPVRAARKAVQLVGLPADGVSPQPRPAHRPHSAVAGAGAALRGLRHRQRAAQVGAAVGSYAGDCHTGLSVGCGRAMPDYFCLRTRSAICTNWFATLARIAAPCNLQATVAKECRTAHRRPAQQAPFLQSHPGSRH